jgi:hypothetical protein
MRLDRVTPTLARHYPPRVHSLDALFILRLRMPFVVRRLERRYGKDTVRAAYERLSGETLAPLVCRLHSAGGGWRTETSSRAGRSGLRLPGDTCAPRDSYRYAARAGRIGTETNLVPQTKTRDHDARAF